MTAYRYRESEPAFAAAWDAAIEEGIDHLVEKSWERAEETSDTLAIFLLKSHRPAVYQDVSRLILGLGKKNREELIEFITGASADAADGEADSPRSLEAARPAPDQ